MTNEQLAAFIKEGGADDLIPVLYSRVENLIYKICGRYYARYRERMTACGVEMSDLRQECYTAFLKALDGFKPAKDTLFTSYLEYPVKSTVFELLGIRSGKVNNKPLDNCTSLDKPITSADGENITLADIIEDTAIEPHDEQITRRDMKRIVRQSVARLDEPCRESVQAYYFKGMTHKQIGEMLGVSGERVRKLIEKAFRQLQEDPEVRELGSLLGFRGFF